MLHGQRQCEVRADGVDSSDVKKIRIGRGLLSAFFDVCSPATRGDAFEVRLQHLRELLDGCPYAHVHPCERTTGSEDVQARLSRVRELGGEGLMLRETGSKYETRRSKTLQKVKTFTDDEPLVVALEDGNGRHEGRLGAFLCLDRGVQFKVYVVAHPHRFIICLL